MKHICFFFALVIVPLNLHSASKDESRSEKINQFKTNMECVNAASSAEDWAKLVPCSKKALELLENLFDPNHPNVAAMTHQYGIALNTHGGYQAESEQLLKSAIKKYEKIYGKNSPELSNVLFDYAEILSKRGRHKQHGTTVKTYVRALDLLKAKNNFDILNYADLAADAFETLSKIVVTSYTFDKTMSLGLNALKIYQEQLGETHYKTAKIALNIGKHFLRIDNNTQSKRAIEFFKMSLQNKMIAPYGHGFLIEAYERTDQSELSIPHLQKLATLRQGDSYQTATLEPVYRPRAIYPRLALLKGIEGSATIVFTVDQTGQVKNVEVLEERPDAYGFGLAALNAAKKLKYLPAIRDGKFVETSGITYVWRFGISK